jgi:DNA polymerase III epsilon subunit-like protein
MIITDIEATGLDADKCSILMAVNGYTMEQATDSRKQSEAELVTRFAAWVARQNTVKIIAGQYIPADIAYLQAACARAGIEYFFPRHFIDLHSISYAEHLKKGIPIPMNNTKPSIRLDDTLKYLGLPEEPKPHIAINGARLETEAFSRLIHGKQLLEEYKQYPLL